VSFNQFELSISVKMHQVVGRKLKYL